MLSPLALLFALPPITADYRQIPLITAKNRPTPANFGQTKADFASTDLSNSKMVKFHYFHIPL